MDPGKQAHLLIDQRGYAEKDKEDICVPYGFMQLFFWGTRFLLVQKEPKGTRGGEGFPQF